MSKILGQDDVNMCGLQRKHSQDVEVNSNGISKQRNTRCNL